MPRYVSEGVGDLIEPLLAGKPDQLVYIASEGALAGVRRSDKGTHDAAIRVLEALVDLPCKAVVLLSDGGYKDVRRRFGVEGLTLLTNHARELVLPDGTVIVKDDDRRTLEAWDPIVRFLAERQLAHLNQSDIEGVPLDHKLGSACFRWGVMGDTIKKAEAVRALTLFAEGARLLGFETMEGDGYTEISGPVPPRKSAAVGALLDDTGAAAVVCLDHEGAFGVFQELRRRVANPRNPLQAGLRVGVKDAGLTRWADIVCRTPRQAINLSWTLVEGARQRRTQS